MKDKCEICGTHQDYLVGLSCSDLTTVDVTSRDEEGTSWDTVTSCRECLVEYHAYKIININENGASKSGWIIDDNRLNFKFFTV